MKSSCVLLCVECTILCSCYLLCVVFFDMQRVSVDEFVVNRFNMLNRGRLFAMYRLLVVSLCD